MVVVEPGQLSNRHAPLSTTHGAGAVASDGAPSAVARLTIASPVVAVRFETATDATWRVEMSMPAVPFSCAEALGSNPFGSTTE